MNETTIETAILKKVDTLNIETYMLACKLDRYKDKLTEPLYKYMANRIETFYREELERIAEPYFLERSREKFQAAERRDTLAPRRWRPWYFLWLKIRENRAAKLIVQEIEKETEEFFDKCEKMIAELPKNEPPTPQNPEETGTQEQDHKSDEPPKSPKAGISQRSQARGSTTGANDQSPQAAPTEPPKKAKKGETI